MAHYKQQFQSTTSHTDLHKFMTLNLVNQLNQIGAMESFTKPNYNLFIEKHLTILK